jgi:uncharacterized protein with von Willebrand factor type A (vWA) domain
MQSPNNEILKTREIAENLVVKGFPSLHGHELSQKLAEKIQDWEKATGDYLANTNPFESQRVKLITSEFDFKAHGGNEVSIKTDLEEYKRYNPEVNTQFWYDKLSSLKKESKNESDTNKQSLLDALRRNEQETWRKDYEKKLLEWQLNEIQTRRDAFIQDLEEWLNTLKRLQEVFEGLGTETGVLWDLSLRELSQQDISFLKKWADYLKNDKGIQQLCDLMGRLQKEANSHRTDIINSTFQYSITSPDIHSNEEIVGIELGRDLANVIPQELALLSDLDVAILFDLKYVENRLMCFSKQGYKNEIFDESIEEEVTVIDDDKLGPIIICVDTSGSMSGAPENIAKAITLTLASRAVAQKRQCYLINFSTSIVTLDLSPPKGADDLIKFLKMSFHGGTDVAPALEEGLRMMSDSGYKRADLLVISDFVINGLSSNTEALCKMQKLEESRFFALSIGNFGMRHMNDSIFDQNWVYNPNTGGISAINNILEWISKSR